MDRIEDESSDHSAEIHVDTDNLILGYEANWTWICTFGKVELLSLTLRNHNMQSSNYYYGGRYNAAADDSTHK